MIGSSFWDKVIKSSACEFTVSHYVVLQCPCFFSRGREFWSESQRSLAKTYFPLEQPQDIDSVRCKVRANPLLREVVLEKLEEEQRKKPELTEDDIVRKLLSATRDWRKQSMREASRYPPSATAEEDTDAAPGAPENTEKSSSGRPDTGQRAEEDDREKDENEQKGSKGYDDDEDLGDSEEDEEDEDEESSSNEEDEEGEEDEDEPDQEKSLTDDDSSPDDISSDEGDEDDWNPPGKRRKLSDIMEEKEEDDSSSSSSSSS